MNFKYKLHGPIRNYRLDSTVMVQDSQDYAKHIKPGNVT